MPITSSHPWFLWHQHIHRRTTVSGPLTTSDLWIWTERPAHDDELQINRSSDPADLFASIKKKNPPTLTATWQQQRSIKEKNVQRKSTVWKSETAAQKAASLILTRAQTVSCVVFTWSRKALIINSETGGQKRSNRVYVCAHCLTLTSCCCCCILRVKCCGSKTEREQRSLGESSDPRAPAPHFCSKALPFLSPSGLVRCQEPL